MSDICEAHLGTKVSAFPIVPSHGSGAHNWATAFLVIFALSGLGTGGSKHFANTAVFWKYWGRKSIIQVWRAGAIGDPFFISGSLCRALNSCAVWH